MRHWRRAHYRFHPYGRLRALIFSLLRRPTRPIFWEACERWILFHREQLEQIGVCEVVLEEDPERSEGHQILFRNEVGKVIFSVSAYGYALHRECDPTVRRPALARWQDETPEWVKLPVDGATLAWQTLDTALQVVESQHRKRLI